MSRHASAACEEEEDPDSQVPLLLQTDHHHHHPPQPPHPHPHHVVGPPYDRGGSPALSVVSAQSHELKYIFEPCPNQAEKESPDSHSDYSHINIRPKPRLCSGGGDGGGAFLGRPPAYSRYEGSSSSAGAVARFPSPHNALHVHGQPGSVPHHHGGGVQRFRSQPQSQAASREDVSGYDPNRRKSWSPPLLRHSAQGYHTSQATAAGHNKNNARSCYSSNMVDLDNPALHAFGAYNHLSYPQGHPQGYPPPPPPGRHLQGQHPQGHHPQGHQHQGHQPQGHHPQGHHLHGHATVHPQPHSHHHQQQGFHPANTFQSHPPPYQQNPSQGHLQGHLQGPVNPGEAEVLPPRLAPVSGVLSERLSRNLIRPIAFKPAYARPRLNLCPQCGDESGSCACQSPSPSRTHPTPPDPYLCQSPRSPGQRSSNASQVSEHSPGDSANANRSAGGYVNEGVHCHSNANDNDSPPGVSVDRSPITTTTPVTTPGGGRPSAAGSEVVTQTPSPSDSGVCELEAMLKEREAEILTLRQVMDRNERAIFQVYEEKKGRWLGEMRDIRDEYERKLKGQQLKAGKLEQALSLQVRRLTLDKQTMQGKVSNLQAEREATLRLSLAHAADASYSSEPDSANSSTLSLTPNKKVSNTGSGGVGGGGASSSNQSSPGGVSQTPALQDEVAMRNTEILALRSQLQSLQGQLEDKTRQLARAQEEAAARAQEVASVRSQLDDLSHVDRASICEECTQTGDAGGDGGGGGGGGMVVRPAVLSDEEYTCSLERQAQDLMGRVGAAEALVESERLQWLEEKNKVIRYQKQLQLNYVQMQRKNTALEAEVEQLTMELESRDLKLTALNGEESVC